MSGPSGSERRRDCSSVPCSSVVVTAALLCLFFSNRLHFLLTSSPPAPAWYWSGPQLPGSLPPVPLFWRDLAGHWGESSSDPAAWRRALVPGQSLVCGEPSDGQRAGGRCSGPPRSRQSAWPALLGMVAAGPERQATVFLRLQSFPIQH